MRKGWMIVAGAAALSGCVTPMNPPPGNGPIAIERDSISYTTSACFGACPVYSLTVYSDGRGVFDGRRFTEAKGEHKFTLTPAQYRAFEARLAPYRPESGARRIVPGQPECKNVATDLPGVEIRWTRAIGDSQSLDVYFGCNMGQNAKMNAALGSAPEVLPIEALIGARP